MTRHEQTISCDKPYRYLEIGKSAELEPHPSKYGHFDENRNSVFSDFLWGNCFFPWEWIYMPYIVEYAKECGVELPDGTIDYRKLF